MAEHAVHADPRRSTAAPRLRDRVASAAEAQKDRAADGLGSVADVTKDVGQELRPHNELIASMVNAASDHLRRVADGLRDRDFRDVMNSLSGFARRRPGLFLGGAFMLGLVAARLVKSTPLDDAHDIHDWDSYGTDGSTNGSSVSMSDDFAGADRT